MALAPAGAVNRGWSQELRTGRRDALARARAPPLPSPPAWAPRSASARAAASPPSGCRQRRLAAAAALAGGLGAGLQGRAKRVGRRQRNVKAPEVVPTDFALLSNDMPGNAWALGNRVFNKEMGQLILLLRQTPLAGVSDWLRGVFAAADLTPAREPPRFVQSLKLDVEQVIAREEARGVPESSPVVKAVFFSLSWSLDRLWEGRPIQKFWVLETVARLPYFSYVTVLHLYESLGWWRTPQIRDLHTAEEHNELHHLLIMEALGGNCSWFDRFAAQHAAILYYWVVVGLFIANPKLAYNFSLLVEEHAYVTYSEFVEANREILKQFPPPPVARHYYIEGDLYYFDKFQSNRKEGLPRRRPPCDTLLDVFTNIRDDEYEHIATMKACQDWWGGDGPSPLPAPDQLSLGSREEWLRWSAQVNTLASGAKPLAGRAPGGKSGDDRP